MELPVFQENLRSSAGWVTELAVERRSWQAASADALIRARELQITETAATNQFSADHANNFALAASFLTELRARGASHLDKDHLNTISQRLSGESSVRPRETEPIKLAEYHDPSPARILPRLIDNALDWFQTPSFAEIHPVEQATIAHLRLLDLQPFATMNLELAHLVASFFTERAGLPPLVLFSGDEAVAQYVAARDMAFRMLTQPLVELFAKNLTRTIRLVLV